MALRALSLAGAASPTHGRSLRSPVAAPYEEYVGARWNALYRTAYLAPEHGRADDAQTTNAPVQSSVAVNQAIFVPRGEHWFVERVGQGVHLDAVAPDHRGGAASLVVSTEAVWARSSASAWLPVSNRPAVAPGLLTERRDVRI